MFYYIHLCGAPFFSVDLLSFSRLFWVSVHTHQHNRSPQLHHHSSSELNSWKPSPDAWQARIALNWHPQRFQKKSGMTDPQMPSLQVLLYRNTTHSLQNVSNIRSLIKVGDSTARLKFTEERHIYIHTYTAQYLKMTSSYNVMLQHISTLKGP